jgi:hypothetical protein
VCLECGYAPTQDTFFVPARRLIADDRGNRLDPTVPGMQQGDREGDREGTSVLMGT